jgi:hypothetical protein
LFILQHPISIVIMKKLVIAALLAIYFCSVSSCIKKPDIPPDNSS